MSCWRGYYWTLVPEVTYRRSVSVGFQRPIRGYKLVSPGGTWPIITILKVPKAGGIPTTKANVVRWLKQEGDAVKLGEPVVELETEKVSYVDALGYTLAQKHDLVFLTGDKAFKGIEGVEHVP